MMSEPLLHFRHGLHAATVQHLARRLSEAETSLHCLTGGAVDAVLDAAGNPYLLRVAQERFRKNESRVLALLDSVPDVIIATNYTGKILFQSAAATRLLGYASEELVGKNIFEFVHSDDVRQLYHTIFAVIENFSETAIVDFHFVFGDGTSRIFEASVGRLLHPSESKELLLILRDPGSRREAQVDAVRQKTACETKRFLARLSLELQTPLALALLGVDALESGRSAELKPNLDLIRRNLARQSALLKELMDFANTEVRAAKAEASGRMEGPPSL